MKLLAFLFFLSVDPARADDCGWNADRTDYGCSSSHSGAAVGGSAPVLGDTLESNPAALPVSDSPFGLEGSWSDRSAPAGRSKFSVSTIKGFDGIGFGLGSWSLGTFGAPDFTPHFLGTGSDTAYRDFERSPPSTLGIRLGTTVLLPRGPFPKGIRFSVGGSAGLGRVRDDWSPQAGILARFYIFGVGYSRSFELLATTLPRVTVSILASGVQLNSLYLGYSYITLSSVVNRTFANVVGARWNGGLWTFYGSLKWQKDSRGAPDIWTRAGLQRRLGKRLGVGYEYGLYRLSHTAILQLFL